MSFDVAAIRADFAIFEDHPGLHYLDSAATAQVPDPVVEAVARHDQTARANVRRGVHALGEAATDAFEAARETVAGYLGSPTPEQVVFCSGTTDALNMLAWSLSATLAPGDRIVATRSEHHSNLIPWHLAAERCAATLELLAVDPATGGPDVTDLARLADDRCRVIAVTHASNVTGAVTDLAPFVAAAQRCGAKLVVDGAQRVARGPVDLAALGCDFYAFSGHKMYGPGGIGILWGKADALAALPPAKGGGGMVGQVAPPNRITYARPPYRFEAGTPPIAQAVGLATAVRWLSAIDLVGARAHMAALTTHLKQGLGRINSVRILGPDVAAEDSAVVSFTLDGVHPHDLCQILDARGVAARGGHHCAEPLMAAFGIDGCTRASLGLYSTEADVEALVAGVEEAQRRLA